MYQAGRVGSFSGRGRLELQQPDRALDSLATLYERRLSKIAHFKLAKSNRSITTVMTPPRRRMLDDMMIGEQIHQYRC
jgi:hypothetical protein